MRPLALLLLLLPGCGSGPPQPSDPRESKPFWCHGFSGRCFDEKRMCEQEVTSVCEHQPRAACFDAYNVMKDRQSRFCRISMEACLNVHADITSKSMDYRKITECEIR